MFKKHSPHLPHLKASAATLVASCLFSFSCAPPASCNENGLALPDEPTLESLLRSCYPSFPCVRDKYFWVSARAMPDQPFKRHQLLAIFCNRPELDVGRLPGPGSTGIVAFDGSALIHLYGPACSSNFSRILKSEALDLGSVDAPTFARATASTILANGRQSIRVLSTSDDLRQFELQGYKLDEQAFGACSSKILPPSITGSKATGWHLRFFTVEGWMHELEKIKSYDVSITPQYDISIDNTTLTDHIFSRVPRILY